MSDENESDKVVIKDKWYLVGDSKGNASISTTLLMISFFVTTVAYVINMFNLTWMKSFDVAATSVYLTPIVALYFGRRHTESKQGES